MATKAGVMTTAVQTKAPKVDKKAEEARLRHLPGEDEEGEKGLLGGPAKDAKGTEHAQAGQDDKAKVRRKKVKLSELTGKKTTAKGQTQTATAQNTAEAKEAKAQAAGQPTPEEQGRKLANMKLAEQGRLAQTRLQHAARSQAANDPNNCLNGQGFQRRLLNACISYQHNNLMQHTGDKAGEIYNRPATRQIFQALVGIKNGGAAGTCKASNDDRGSGNVVAFSPAAMKAKTKEANKMLEMFMLAEKQPPPGYEPTELVA